MTKIIFGPAVLAPVPVRHLEAAIDVLKEKDFVLFGTRDFEFFNATEIGCRVLIYPSHDEAKRFVSYTATYEGLLTDPREMRHLERDGYRPLTTQGEKWPCYWKVANVTKLTKPIRLDNVELASGKKAVGIPRRPLHVVV